MSVGSVILELAAPAISCGIAEDASCDETVLVYDLRDGTFGVTLIDIEIFQVDEDHDLGGLLGRGGHHVGPAEAKCRPEYVSIG